MSRPVVVAVAALAAVGVVLQGLALLAGTQLVLSVAGVVAGQSKPRTTPAVRSFQARFEGQLVRNPGAGNALTWDIEGQWTGETKGAVSVVLIGQSTSEGLAVASGRVSLRPTGGVACSGTVVKVVNNVVSALCAPNGGDSTPTTIMFAVAEGDHVTGSVTVGSSGGTPVPVTSPSPSPAPGHATDTGANIFVIVLENLTYDKALTNAYVSSLARQYALATNYHAISHPSLPNYLALTSGDTFGVQDDSYRRLPPGGLGDQLTAAGLTWNAYAEGMTSGCLNSPYPYAVKHNPFAFYGGACPSNVVSMDQLNADLAGTTPRLSWLIPNMCNDGHDCPPATADKWLARTVPNILNSAAWKHNGILLITWDEDDSSGDNHVATLIVAPNLTGHLATAAYDHYSLLATIEDRLGLPRLGNAASAQPISEVFPA
jgi:hypothetical protein